MQRITKREITVICRTVSKRTYESVDDGQKSLEGLRIPFYTNGLTTSPLEYGML